LEKFWKAFSKFIYTLADAWGLGYAIRKYARSPMTTEQIFQLNCISWFVAVLVLELGVIAITKEKDPFAQHCVILFFFIGLLLLYSMSK